MIAAIRAEFRKLFSTRMWWILALGMVAYLGLIGFGLAALLGSAKTGRLGDVVSTANLGTLGSDTDDDLRSVVYGLAPTLGYVFPAIIGAMGLTSEYRHHTIVPTLLAEPRRPVVAVAKILASIPMGAVLGIVGTAACVLAGAGGFAVGGLSTGLDSIDTWRAAALSALALTIWALVGAGLGMLVTSQVGAIVALLVFTQLVEPLARLVLMMNEHLSGIARFLPGAAGEAVTGQPSIYSAMTISTSVGGPITAAPVAPLTVWQAALVLCGYALFFGIVGYWTRFRRDVS